MTYILYTEYGGALRIKMRINKIKYEKTVDICLGRRHQLTKDCGIFFFKSEC